LPKANLYLVGAKGFWPNPLKPVRRVLFDKEREGAALSNAFAILPRWIRAFLTQSFVAIIVMV
jgi:hypothetical protein